MIDTDQLKRQVNIIDIISQSITLKKTGKDYQACCPFHQEKTPSFTVSEEKQFYHCFGCGAHGDVLRWLQEYGRMEFFDAIKALGGDIENMPIEKIARNESTSKYASIKKPPDHCEDADMVNSTLACCDYKLGVYVSRSGMSYLPLTDIHGEIKNLVYFEQYDYATDEPKFIAGGPSYDCFYQIKVNDKPEYVAVTSLTVGNAIAAKYKLNVAVCFTGAVMKYVCMWNNGGIKFKPAISDGDDDYLCYEMPWLYWDGENLSKRGIFDA